MAKAISILGDVNPQGTPDKSQLPPEGFYVPDSCSDRILANLPVDRMRPDPDQPRREWNSDDLDELESRIRPANRIIQPIVVRPDPEKKGHYLIKAGEGRWRVASERLGWGHAPVVIEVSYAANNDPREVFSEQILENIGRVNMTPYQLAVSIERWMYGFSPEKSAQEAAIQFGINTTKVSRLRKLLTAPEGVKRLADNRKANINTLNYLADLNRLDEREYLHMLQRVVNDELPDAENALRGLVQKLKTPQTKPKGDKLLDAATQGLDKAGSGMPQQDPEPEMQQEPRPEKAPGVQKDAPAEKPGTPSGAATKMPPAMDAQGEDDGGELRQLQLMAAEAWDEGLLTRPAVKVEAVRGVRVDEQSSVLAFHIEGQEQELILQLDYELLLRMSGLLTRFTE